MSFTAASMQPAEDAHAARWLVDDIRWNYTVASLVTNRFDAYARVFHPAQRGDAFAAGRAVEWVTWADVARGYGRTLHAVAEWGSLVGSNDPNFRSDRTDLWDQAPFIGDLTDHIAQGLARSLTLVTPPDARLWFAIWQGKTKPLVAPTFELPNREMYLFHGTMDVPLAPEELAVDTMMPNLWWPDDRTWCVATEIDLMTTYVGGSRECIDAILANSQLEAWSASPEQRITWDSDTINPLPSGWP